MANRLYHWKNCQQYWEGAKFHHTISFGISVCPNLLKIVPGIVVDDGQQMKHFTRLIHIIQTAAVHKIHSPVRNNLLWAIPTNAHQSQKFFLYGLPKYQQLFEFDSDVDDDDDHCCFHWCNCYCHSYYIYGIFYCWMLKSLLCVI